MSPQPGDCSAGLSTTRVAGRQAGGGHAHRDREREVPRRDDRDDAARGVAHLVALAGHLEERLAAVERDRAARVELEEVDRLADVGVGLAPRLGALAHRERGELGPALAQPGGGARRGSRRARSAGVRDHAGNASRARSRPPRRPRRSWPSARGRRRARASPGSVETSSSPCALVVADPDRDAQRQLAARARHARPASSLALGGAAQLEDRLVGERWRQVGHGAARSSSSERAGGLLVQEALVARVLEQPPDEVGHAGDEVADRAVGAHAQAALGAAPAGGRRRGRAGPGARRRRRRRRWRGWRRSRGRPSAGCATAIATRTARPRLEQAARQRLEVAVGVGLDLEDRATPSRAGAPRRPRGPSRRP